MFHRLSTSTLNWIMIIGVILFLAEVFFFKAGLIFVAALFGIMLYWGWKRYRKMRGKVIFWLGAAGLAFSIFNMLAVRLLIIAGIVLFLMDYRHASRKKAYIAPHANKNEGQAESLLQVEPLFDSRLFGEEQTDDRPYQWHDINLHSLYGDKIIDLSNTVLPGDTAVIAIRQLIGNIEIHIPYEVEVSIHHHSVFGRAHIFGVYHGNLMNKSLHYETAGYQKAASKVKIITSLVSGDIEVKRR